MLRSEALSFARKARAVGWAIREEAYVHGDVATLAKGREMTRLSDLILTELDKPPSFGATVLKADDESRFLLLVAYSANKMPARGADQRTDVASPEVLEKACWNFMDNGAQLGTFHKTAGGGRVVENFVHRGPKWKITGPDGTTQVVRKGDWIVGMILDEPTWQLYKAGRIRGASPQGTARRKPASAETLARIRREEPHVR
ncbi:MAG: hypothetical protein JWM85_2115 [Acidimicrobiaceae bacterium]|nr:hypothetical protein [Acidimicrobiaceae bacterium]